MATRKHYEPSPEQLALAKAREEKKMNKVLVTKDKGPELLSRRWLSLPHTPNLDDPKSPYQHIKVMTWNLLAQSLIRRELFPTSDCLKAGQREPMIHEEILRQDADIICLQEVDRLDKLVPMLEKAGYAHHYGSGPGKKHGCMIAFKKNLFSMVSDRMIYYDQYVPMDDAGCSLTRNTFKTRNIGLVVALRSLNQENEGLIVATTHLFWHPKYTYERTRQAAILLQEVVAFKTDQKAQKWLCILAGDFNFTPSDPAYTLAVGDTLLPEQEAMISSSLVIHSSVDPSVGVNAPASNAASDKDSEDEDPDRVITNARQAESRDGLLTIPQFIAWFSSLPNLRSAYNDGLQEVSKLTNTLPTYGHRVTLPLGRRGLHEPAYTSYTHYWQSVLDYIFILDLKEETADIIGLLEPHSAENLSPGLPKKNISGSDHISLVVELGWHSQSEFNKKSS
ncbi:Endonuclease/exonuclease/phosphatase [Phlegmacium glaucopus]|nr:Endonuclease/exonuclease/phosphatase [Phlegmacium glaucopus]